MCTCVCVLNCNNFVFLFWNVYPAPFARSLAIFLPICYSIYFSISCAFPIPTSLSPSFSLSLSPSPSSHSLCVARVMSARNLPRKLAYKNVDGKYLRSSSSSTAAAKATITATTVEYRQQQQRSSSSSSIPRFSIRFTNLGDWLCHLLAVNWIWKVKGSLTLTLSLYLYLDMATARAMPASSSGKLWNSEISLCDNNEAFCCLIYRACAQAACYR